MELNDLVSQGVDLARQGFSTIDSIQGIVIAVIAAAIMRRASHLIGTAIAATIIHEIVSIVRFAINHDGAISLPDYTNIEVLKLIAVRFAGYLIVIGVLYIVRRVLIRN
ncbi:MAG: hypothetical protein Q7T44_05230 [Parvibaculum sp.]|nr:hypothetical protein [Parvibaculum sp.]